MDNAPPQDIGHCNTRQFPGLTTILSLNHVPPQPLLSATDQRSASPMPFIQFKCFIDTSRKMFQLKVTGSAGKLPVGGGRGRASKTTLHPPLFILVSGGAFRTLPCSLGSRSTFHPGEEQAHLRHRRGDSPRRQARPSAGLRGRQAESRGRAPAA